MEGRPEGKRLTVSAFVSEIVREYKWLMEAKAEHVTVQLQERIIPITDTVAEELFMSSISHPIKVCWPKGKLTRVK